MLGLWATLLFAGAVGAAFAQESPPARVGRLSYIGGSVSFEPAGTHNWAAAELNRPVTIGDRIWTDWDSRAEIQIGDAVVRLGSRSGFSFLNLDAQTAQMQLTAGTMIVHVRTLSPGEQDEVDTPNLALSLEEPGTYQVHVNAAGDLTVVEVIRGAALASGGGQTFQIAAQQSAAFRGSTALNVAYATLGLPDALEEWSMSRDREEAQAAAELSRYVSAQMVGTYDLQTYGSWQDTPQWGYAWFPDVMAGWAPYRFGHWVWIFPWGWTWVDDEPWGFAPFHYGRWAYWHNAWCWVPGPRNVPPVYAPALVAWTHGGGFRGPRPRPLPSPRPIPGPIPGPHRGEQIGWLPLGPRDVYVPGYAASGAYVRDINLANSRDLSRSVVSAALHRGGAGLTYANQRVRGAVTAVPRAVFSASQPADAHRVVFTRRGMLRTRFSPEAPAVTPSRSSVFGARMRSANVPPRQLTYRPVVARLLPARAPISFARQQALIRANRGRPLSAQQWARFRPNMPAGVVRLVPQIRTAAPAPEQGRLRGAFTGEPVPMRSSAPSARRGLQRPPRAPQYRADRPGWAQSGGDRGNYSPLRSRAPVPRMAPGHAGPRYRIRQPPPLPERHVPQPQWRTAQPAPPMYRVQPSFAPPRARPSFAAPRQYAPPRSPPPMYRPMTPSFAPRVAPAPPPPAYHPAPAQPPSVGRPHPPMGP